MLFVDDDQADVLERREHRRARADDDVHVAAADALPLIVPLAVREAAVLDGDAVAEALAEERRDDRRERDLRHEHEHAPARVADARREPQVDLGLAAAGDAVQQRHLELPARRRSAQSRVERGVLLARQRGARDRRRRPCAAAVSNGSRSTRSARRLMKPRLREPRHGVGARCRATRVRASRCPSACRRGVAAPRSCLARGDVRPARPCKGRSIRDRPP